MNRLTKLLSEKKSRLLNIYCTAGYPRLSSTMEVLHALQSSNVDIVEIGIPYSDPIADGPIIQQSNMTALENGISLPVLFSQLKDCRLTFNLPLILMGYLNPVMQYGFEKFCKDAAEVGADAVILPDLPIHEFETIYGKFLKQYNLHFIFLITPETSIERIRKIDDLSTGFIYAVSSSSTTGDKGLNTANMEEYVSRINDMNLKNPVLVGFGIKDNQTFEAASRFASGAIIGSAYIKLLEKSENVQQDTQNFIGKVLNRSVSDFAELK